MLIIKEYNRDTALIYARKWALERNPLFFNYTGYGGDCTNFVSQSIYAGSCVMNFTPTYGWFYLSQSERSAGWTGVEYFYNFMTSNRGKGPFAIEVGREGVEVGDVIQLSNEDGDFYHTLFITQIEDDGEILIAAHSDDALDRPLSSYNNAGERYLHILGVRFDTEPYPQCSQGLIDGTQLLV
jgi:hypothetical protein